MTQEDAVNSNPVVSCSIATRRRCRRIGKAPRSCCMSAQTTTTSNEFGAPLADVWRSKASKFLGLRSCKHYGSAYGLHAAI